jgi:hypothetical protein
MNEPVSGFARGEGFGFFVDSEIGMTMDETKTKEMPDGTWEASAKIGTIFGAEVEGELTGKGASREEALAALAKERHELHESLWL